MPVAPDLCGTALGERYELHALIGEGAFGRVYRGRDRRLERPVAVKVIKPWWAEDPGWVGALQREARLLARCSDPAIVQIFDVGESAQGPYCVSELVDGEDLARRLARGRLALPEAVRIARGLCDGLAAAHQLGIVHRDVKPANVLLDRRGAVKVGDFGVARLAESTSGDLSALSAAVVGTPRYMAPEQSRGDGTVTAAADVYSAGAVIYEMLAGCPPFVDRTPVALALAHLADPPPPLPDAVPEPVRRVVMRALAKDPGDRFADAGQLRAALAGAAAPAPARTATAAARAPARNGTAAGPAPARTGTAAGPAPAQTGADAPAGVAPSAGETLSAPRRAPRATFDPAARRRRAGLLLAAVVVLAALIAAAVLSRGHAVQVRHRPHGAAAAARRVELPLLVGEDVTAATARLHAQGLRVAVDRVPAPGIRPGTVTSESPAPGRTARTGSIVHLAVSEVPTWHTVTTFSGRSSPPISIRGDSWRVLVSADSATHCTLLVFCHGTTVSASRLDQGSPFAHFGAGANTAHTFAHTGPGSYRVTVAPASGSTRWTVRVQDLY